MLRDDYLARIKSKHYSKNTFEAYWPHIEGFIRWNKRGQTWRQIAPRSAAVACCRQCRDLKKSRQWRSLSDVLPSSAYQFRSGRQILKPEKQPVPFRTSQLRQHATYRTESNGNNQIRIHEDNGGGRPPEVLFANSPEAHRIWRTHCEAPRQEPAH